MSKINTEEFLQHPKFQLLTKSRGRLSLMLSLFIFAGYSIFVLGMAYFPGWMATPLSENSSVTIGILIGVMMIIAGVLCSGYYMKHANSDFDSLKQELLKELDYE